MPNNSDNDEKSPFASSWDDGKLFIRRLQAGDKWQVYVMLWADDYRSITYRQLVSSHSKNQSIDVYWFAVDNADIWRIPGVLKPL